LTKTPKERLKPSVAFRGTGTASAPAAWMPFSGESSGLSAGVEVRVA
jgi:hypothetical protein